MEGYGDSRDEDVSGPRSRGKISTGGYQLVWLRNVVEFQSDLNYRPTDDLMSLSVH